MKNSKVFVTKNANVDMFVELVTMNPTLLPCLNKFSFFLYYLYHHYLLSEKLQKQEQRLCVQMWNWRTQFHNFKQQIN